ncbi:calcium/proton exchanger [Tundrisphaera lichenicola]|uniref:calcium/proton exchanger n=1 Tax=Tundrisphaera lichenicola TaxID=2029860 RepID=UPI003EB9FC7B
MARNRVNRTNPRGPSASTAPGPGRGAEPRSVSEDHAWYDPRGFGWETFLLAAVPAAIVASFLETPAVVRFLAAGVAIIPLAGLMGRSTEQLAHRLGSGIGGLLNATFGNAAELILALFALRKGLDDVVKASLTGSIIGNLLLVLGASLLAGGLKYPIQKFNRTAAGIGSTLMVLATTGLIVPAMFHHLHPQAIGLEHKLSVSVCVLLMITYGLNLIFSLGTHRDLFSGVEQEGKVEASTWGVRRASLVLLAATVFVAWMSEILVGAVESTSETLGMNGVFMGVVVVAIVGNAAEHSTAILMALKNQMDLAVGIALGSALQVALFVAPVLVFASYLRDEPMDLLFTPLEVVSVVLAVMIARMVAEDGESNWLEGAMLLMVYAILGLAFFYLPAARLALAP